MSLGCAALLAACNLPGQEQSTATPSSEDVLQTAQAIVAATLSVVTDTPSPLPPTDTPGLPTETPTPPATATPESPLITADYNANVRRGPGEEYEIVDFILAGEQADVIGRYDDSAIGTWWLIQRIGEGRNGWVWAGAVTLSGSDFGVPPVEPPPTSTPTPEPTGPPVSTDTPTPTATP
jgi:uncharacterized protein YgiM (DUF1202 family)